MFLALYSPRSDSVVSADDVQLLSARVAREQGRCFHEVDKRSRPSTLLFVGAVNQSPQFAQIYQYLRHQLCDSAGAGCAMARRNENVQRAVELCRDSRHNVGPSQWARETRIETM